MAASAPAVWDLDLATGLFLVSDRLCDIYGSSPGELDLGTFVDATHPQDVEWTAAMRGAAGGPRHLPQQPFRYRIRRLDTGEIRWIHAHMEVAWSSDETRTPVGYTGTIEDVTELMKATDALVESEERLRLAIEAGKMAVWEVELQTGKITNSPELNALCGFPPDAKPTFEDVRALYAPGEKERLHREGATVEAVRARSAAGAFETRSASAAGADRTQIQAEVSIITPAGLSKRLLLRAQYTPTSEGRPRLTGLLVDITERKLAEERLGVVARELQHRVKNSLAVVQMLATQSFRSNQDTEAALQAFLGRLQALAKVTDIMLDGGASDAGLVDVVRAITEPYRSPAVDPFRIRGADVRIPGKVASTISMALHELSTNAVKYGSLSVSGGRVGLEWGRRSEGGLVIDWHEDGGPKVVPPDRQGFGTRLLHTLVSAELGGSIEFDYAATGLRCRILMGPETMVS